MFNFFKVIKLIILNIILYIFFFNQVNFYFFSKLIFPFDDPTMVKTIYLLASLYLYELFLNFFLFI